LFVFIGHARLTLLKNSGPCNTAVDVYSNRRPKHAHNRHSASIAVKA